MIEELWYKIHILGQEYRKKVEIIVEEIAREIGRQHDAEIRDMAESLGARAILSVRVEGVGPTQIYPCLYLVVSLQRALNEKDRVSEEARRMLGDWAHHARLRIDTVGDVVEEYITPKIKVWGT